MANLIENNQLYNQLKCSLLKSRILGISIFIFCLFCSFHPFYLSVTEINFDAKQSDLQINIRIFTDDLEKTLRNTTKMKIDLLDKENYQVMSKLVDQYVQSKFIIKIDGKEINYKWIGYERDEDAIWIYFESAKLPKPSKIEVDNKLLYELYDEQMNIVKINIAGKKQSSKLNNPNFRFVFDSF